MEEVEFDQGAWGLATRRPTSATTNYNLDCLKRQHQAEEETEDPTTTEWPPTLKHALAIAVGRERFKFQAVCEDGALKAMTPEQCQLPNNVKVGRYPSRRDCLQCVTHGATGHRHARVEHPSLFCLNVDITGSFRTTGEDPGARGDRSKGSKNEVLVGGEVYDPQVLCDGRV